MLALLLIVSFCVFNFSVYVPLLARQVLGLGAEGFGFLMAAMGVGAVAGAVALGTLVPGRPPLLVLFAAAMLACAGLVGLSMVRQFAVAVPVLFVVGFFGIIATAGSNTTLQLSAPDRLRGRVMSIYTLIFGGSFPIASVLIGLISERWSVSRAFLIAGVLGMLLSGRGDRPLAPGHRAADSAVLSLVAEIRHAVAVGAGLGGVFDQEPSPVEHAPEQQIGVPACLKCLARAFRSHRA